MKQTARIISTYSADVMGVCSALFELGGMTIMHDASGCNSTYTTHDEPRWYDMDSMVYISGISEMEAIMGDDEKLLSDIEDAAQNLHPAFIAIAGTPIPAMTGFDFEAVAQVAEQRTGIPSFGFPTTGMNTYIHGASMAFAGIAKRFVKDPQTAHASDIAVTRSGNVTEITVDTSHDLAEAGSGDAGSITATVGDPQRDKIRVNILGLTPLDFSVNGTDASLVSWLESRGFEVISRWAMGNTLEEISRSAEADVDLVVSAAGLGAAEVLNERFGIPFAVGLPVGEEYGNLIESALKDLALNRRNQQTDQSPSEQIQCLVPVSDIDPPGASNNQNGISNDSPGASSGSTGTQNDITGTPNDQSNVSYDSVFTPKDITVAVIGEGITSLSIASAIELDTGCDTMVLCATECPEWILRGKDSLTPDEDDIIPKLRGATHIIADPLYRPICPAEARFIPLPSEAFSGRIYREDIPDLITLDIKKLLDTNSVETK